MRTMNASATLVISQGHHPANHRSAIPTRAYESGSGHGHDAAPAGHPHPPRPPPRPAPIPPRPCPRRPSSAPIRAWVHPCLPRTAPANQPKTTQITQTPARHLQKLDEPLHMSAQLAGVGDRFEGLAGDGRKGAGGGDRVGPSLDADGAVAPGGADDLPGRPAGPDCDPPGLPLWCLHGLDRGERAGLPTQPCARPGNRPATRSWSGGG